MPEIPSVVPGEPVEADWGNDIRDRSVQKYADLTALEASQPVPQLGEVAWLSNPGYLVVCTDAATPVWTPLLDQSDGDDRWVLVAGEPGHRTASRILEDDIATAIQGSTRDPGARCGGVFRLQQQVPTTTDGQSPVEWLP